MDTDIGLGLASRSTGWSAVLAPGYGNFEEWPKTVTHKCKATHFHPTYPNEFHPLRCHAHGRPRACTRIAQAHREATDSQRRALYYEKRLAARRNMVNTPTRYGVARTRTWYGRILSGKS